MYDKSQYCTCTAVGIQMNKSFSQGLDTKIKMQFLKCSYIVCMQPVSDWQLYGLINCK